MESKIIRVINKMISNSKRIGNVVKGALNSNEYYFTYDTKYKWSIVGEQTTNKDIVLYYYPLNDSIEQIAQMDETLLEYVTYKCSDFKTKEAEESFRELLTIVKSNYLGIDQVFDQILDDTDDLPW